MKCAVTECPYDQNLTPVQHGQLTFDMCTYHAMMAVCRGIGHLLEETTAEADQTTEQYADENDTPHSLPSRRLD